MGWQFRRSKKVAPGVRVTLGKRSAGVSVGPRHAHLGYNTKRGLYTSFSIPGTGISYRQNLNKLAPAVFQAIADHSPSLPPPNPFTVPVTWKVAPGYNVLGVTLGCVVWAFSPLVALLASLVTGINFMDWMLGLLSLGVVAIVAGYKTGAEKDAANAPQRHQQDAVNTIAVHTWNAILEGRNQDALAGLKYLRGATPANVEVIYYQACVFAAFDLARARDLMNAYLRHPSADAFKGFYTLGHLLMQIGDYAGADDSFFKARDLTCDAQMQAVCIGMRAWAVWTNGQPSLALEILRSGGWHRRHITDPLSATMHFLGGHCHFELRQIPQARREWEKVAAYDPHFCNVAQCLQSI